MRRTRAGVAHEWPWLPLRLRRWLLAAAAVVRRWQSDERGAAVLRHVPRRASSLGLPAWPGTVEGALAGPAPSCATVCWLSGTSRWAVPSTARRTRRRLGLLSRWAPAAPPHGVPGLVVTRGHPVARPQSDGTGLPLGSLGPGARARPAERQDGSPQRGSVVERGPVGGQHPIALRLCGKGVRAAIPPPGSLASGAEAAGAAAAVDGPEAAPSDRAAALGDPAGTPARAMLAEHVSVATAAARVHALAVQLAADKSA